MVAGVLGHILKGDLLQARYLNSSLPIAWFKLAFQVVVAVVVVVVAMVVATVVTFMDHPWTLHGHIDLPRIING